MHLTVILIVSWFKYQIRFNMILFNFFSPLILNNAHKFTELVTPTNELNCESAVSMVQLFELLHHCFILVIVYGLLFICWFTFMLKYAYDQNLAVKNQWGLDLAKGARLLQLGEPRFKFQLGEAPHLVSDTPRIGLPTRDFGFAPFMVHS